MTEPICTTLSNGLRVITVALPHLHSAEIAIYVKTGGRNDPPGRSGLSHFLEHMLFRGTAEYASSLEIESAFENLGGGVNAATDADSTWFYGRIHPDFAPQGIKILSSLILRPRLEGIDLERRIICEEALEDISEEGEEISPDVVVGRMLWPDHPLGNSTVGSLDDIARISGTDLKLHLDKWYRPNNSVLVAAGPLDHSLISKAAEEYLGEWKSGELPETLPVPAVLPAGPACRFVNDSSSQVTMQLSFRTCHRQSPDLTTLKVLRRLLAGGGCSRLHLALREKLGLVYSVDASIGSYADTGCLSIDLSTAPENLMSVLEATIAELRLLADTPVCQHELERVRTVYLADLDYSRDSVGEMGIRFGWGSLMGITRSIDEDQQLVRDVTAGMVRQLASDLFRPSNRFLGIIGPVAGLDRNAVEQLLSAG